MAKSKYKWMYERIEFSRRKGTFYLSWKIEKGWYGKVILSIRTMPKGKGKLLYRTSCIQDFDSIANALERVAKRLGVFYYINQRYYMEVVEENRNNARQQLSLKME